MSKPTDAGRRSSRQGVFAVLADLKWHGGAELVRAGGNRYSARVDELRALGYEIDRRSTDAAEFDEYKLKSTTPGAARTQKVRVDFTEWELSQLMEHKKTPDSVKEKIARAWDRMHAKKAKAQKLYDEMPDANRDSGITQDDILKTLMGEEDDDDNGT